MTLQILQLHRFSFCVTHQKKRKILCNFAAKQGFDCYFSIYPSRVTTHSCYFL